jgi:hypothetical protein
MASSAIMLEHTSNFIKGRIEITKNLLTVCKPEGDQWFFYQGELATLYYLQEFLNKNNYTKYTNTTTL